MAAFSVHRALVTPRWLQAGSALVRAIARRQVVRATLMRATLHHVTTQDYLAYGGELRARRIAFAEAQLAKFPGTFEHDGLVEAIVRHASERPRSRPELLFAGLWARSGRAGRARAVRAVDPGDRRALEAEGLALAEFQVARE